MPLPLWTTSTISSPPWMGQDVDPRCPGIDRVFDQFLDDAGGPLDHFACGDL
jgi:hypothetical protein